jgi:hypothetical protein
MRFCRRKKIYFAIINIFYHNIADFRVHIQNGKNVLIKYIIPMQQPTNIASIQSIIVIKEKLFNP